MLPGRLGVRFALEALFLVLLAIGALAELFAVGGGLYWVGAAFVVLTLGAVVNAWVLLVEILR